MSEASSQDLAAAFNTHFQSRRTELEPRLSALSAGSGDDLKALTVDLIALRKNLVDAINEGYLPAYDQRQMELQMANFEKALESGRAASAPTKRFAFKRKAATPTASSPSAPSKPTSATPVVENGRSSTSLVLSDRKNAWLTISDIPDRETRDSACDLSISNVEDCVIDLRTSRDEALAESSSVKLTAIHVRNIQRSILLLPELGGSILAHSLQACTLLIGGCQQFRIHSSSNIDVMLTISSNPVIEHCSGIRFGSLSEAEANDQAALLFTPQDFSHLRTTPSPNWRSLTSAEVHNNIERIGSISINNFKSYLSSLTADK